MRARFILAALSLCTPGVASGGSVQTLTFAPNATPTTASVVGFDGSAWASASGPAALAGSIAWQVLRASPVRDEYALVTLSASRQLTHQLRTGTSWGSAFTLASDCGAAESRVFAAEHEGLSGDLVAVYRKGTDTALYFRVFNGSWSAEQSVSLGLSAAPRWIELAPGVGRDGMILLAASGTSLHAAVWNGSAFTNSQSLTTALPAGGRPFAAAWSSSTGDAVVAWGRTSSGPQFRRWSGGSWTSASTMPGSTGVHWLALAANPASGSAEVLAGTLDTANDLRVMQWSGSAWSTATVVETNVGVNAERRFDLAYDPEGTRAVIAWQASGVTALRYRVFTGGSWSAQATTSALGSEPLSVHLSPGPAPGRIAAAVRRRGTASHGDFVMYSTGGSVLPGTATVIGAVGSGAGVTLPSSPSGNSGSTQVNVAHNGTRNMTPGAYGRVAVGNNTTLNFPAGDYFMEYFDAQSSHDCRINLNTSAGDVRLIFTNGNFQHGDRLTINATGGGRAQIFIRNGNFEAKHDATITGVELYVLNGNITASDRVSFTGGFFASGNVEMNNGAVTLGHAISTPADLLSALVFADGVPGTPATVTSTLLSAGVRDAFSLSGVGRRTAPRLTQWREVGTED